MHPLSTCPWYLKQVAPLARTMTPSTCHVMLSLGTGQTRSDCVLAQMLGHVAATHEKASLCFIPDIVGTIQINKQ